MTTVQTVEPYRCEHPPYLTPDQNASGEIEGRKISCCTRFRNWCHENNDMLFKALLITGVACFILGAALVISGLATGISILATLGQIFVLTGASAIVNYRLFGPAAK